MSMSRKAPSDEGVFALVMTSPRGDHGNILAETTYLCPETPVDRPRIAVVLRRIVPQQNHSGRRKIQEACLTAKCSNLKASGPAATQAKQPAETWQIESPKSSGDIFLQGLRALDPQEPPGSLTSAAHVVHFPKDARTVRA